EYLLRHVFEVRLADSHGAQPAAAVYEVGAIERAELVLLVGARRRSALVRGQAYLRVRAAGRHRGDQEVGRTGDDLQRKSHPAPIDRPSQTWGVEPTSPRVPTRRRAGSGNARAPTRPSRWMPGATRPAISSAAHGPRSTPTSVAGTASSGALASTT